MATPHFIPAASISSNMSAIERRSADGGLGNPTRLG
jgi:hypothetical protein